MTNIISPVNGEIRYIDDSRITIYISAKDNHKIYAPMSGEISYMSITNGYWERQYYKTIYGKTGHLSVEINKTISFWVEVGKPKYITDTIRVDYKEGDTVEEGQRIGEIIIGSLAEISLPPDAQVMKNIKKGTKVVGGKTVLFKLNRSEYAIKDKAILITVPHGYCANDMPSGKMATRRCDRRAEQSADILSQILKSKTNLKIITIKSKMDRQIIDENRIQSRNDEFRNEIDNILDKYDVIWTIDMHSFPMGGFEPQHTNWPYLKFVILDNVAPRISKEHWIFDFNFEYYELLQGSTVNDIQEQSRDLGVPSILIEVLEDKELTDTELKNFLIVVTNRILKNQGLKEIYYS